MDTYNNTYLFNKKLGTTVGEQNKSQEYIKQENPQVHVEDKFCRKSAKLCFSLVYSGIDLVVSGGNYG